MEAVAWTAIGLLAATFGVLASALLHLDGKIDALGRDLAARIDGLGGSLGARLYAMNRDLGARIDAVDQDLGARIDAQTSRIDPHLSRHEL